jgi:hypothetical protein
MLVTKHQDLPRPLRQAEKQGIFEFFPQVAADVFVHRLAVHKHGQSRTAPTKPDGLSYSALTDDGRPCGIIKHIAINVGPKVLFKSPFVDRVD